MKLSEFFLHEVCMGSDIIIILYQMLNKPENYTINQPIIHQNMGESHSAYFLKTDKAYEFKF